MRDGGATTWASLTQQPASTAATELFIQCLLAAHLPALIRAALQQRLQHHVQHRLKQLGLVPRQAQHQQERQLADGFAAVLRR